MHTGKYFNSNSNRNPGKPSLTNRNPNPGNRTPLLHNP